MENKEDVKKRIGKECWDLIMGSVDSGTLYDQKMKDLAFGLGQKIGRNHQARVEKVGILLPDQRELIRIFGDWWESKDGLETMSRQEAIQRLIELFRDRNIGLYPLVKDLEDVLARSTTAEDGAGGSSVVDANSNRADADRADKEAQNATQAEGSGAGTGELASDPDAGSSKGQNTDHQKDSIQNAEVSRPSTSPVASKRMKGEQSYPSISDCLPPGRKSASIL